VQERRRANKDGRRACQLWDAKDAVPWEACPRKPDGNLPTAAEATATATLAPSERCTACVPLPPATKATGEKGCGTACQASATAAKHTVWACQKAGDCLATAPGDAADQAVADATKRVWRAVTAVVDPKGSKTGDAADTQGGNYALAKAGLEAAVKEVGCIDFATAMLGKAEPGLLTRLAAPDTQSKDPALADATKKVLYVCAKGRAYQC